MDDTPASMGSSPFSNLDIWFDWTGSPNDAVDVSIAIEAWCTPNIRLPVFNIHSPYMVGGPTFSIVPKNKSKSESKRTDGDAYTGTGADGASDTTRPFTDAPVTPNSSIKNKGKYKKIESATKSKFDALVDGDEDSDASGTKSLMFSPGSPEESTRPVNIGVLYTQADTSLSDLSTPSRSPNSRKRTATAASLPDSIPDEDRDVRYDGDGKGHTVTVVKPKLASPGSSVHVPVPVPVPVAKVPSDDSNDSPLRHRSRPISIPRPASLDMDVLPERVPLPTDSAPVSAVDFRRLENSDLFQRQFSPGKDASRNTAQGNDGEEEGFFDAWASLGPHDQDYSKRTPEIDEKKQKLDALSTIVSPGNSSHFGGKEDSLADYESDISSGNDDDDCGGVFGVPLARLFTPRRSSAPSSNAGAQLIIIENTIYMQTSPTIWPATYELSIKVSIHVRKGQNNWWEVALTGLPQLCPDEYGYLYFRTPRGQGMEYRTTGFKRNKIAENYLIAQFVVTQRFLVPFRTCDATFYGLIKDFKVHQLIQTEVKDDDTDPLRYLVSYRALCSIDLVQRDFWAEKCSFDLYIHGGPDGMYTGELQSDQNSLQTFKLDNGTDIGSNNCQVRITCPRSSLSVFMLTWETRLPYHAAVSWTPQIKTRPFVSEAELKLQQEFALFKLESKGVMEANPDTQEEVPRGEPPEDFVKLEKSNLSRMVQWLWITWDIFWFLFQLVTLLASFTIIYSCSLRKGSGFLAQISGGYTLYCSEQLSFPDIPVPALNFTPEDWPVMENIPVEVFKPASIDLETVEAKKLQPESTPSETEPATLPPFSLRDNIDYFLGWRGPIENQ
ncbi:uncharacterized protein N7511_005801 [Penicillium nucicola]|uniref:uncharacterized protein n=1 Tax=Penicillium nucicola TaxID=1850975 RepID=UPI00254582EB|nr:uncharacterized protein N7511_005801 [Penicillium nucicola]KAJ5762419.1 hypothetical protein N7511_005801 [Penicillium nucicola]